MKKTIISIIIVIIIVLSTIMGTYAVVINVTEDNNGSYEIINKITIKDLVTDDSGNYNNIYYNVVNELNINETEANTLIESIYLNNSLKTLLNSIVDYKLKNGSKLSNEKLYDMIINDINNDNNISRSVKEKVTNSANKYINDISDYVYDINVNLLGDKQ